MRLILFLILLSITSVSAQDVIAPSSSFQINQPPSEPIPLISHCYCGRDAHYAGGNKALSAFINKHISFPSDMDWGNTDHFRAYVMFIVGKDGSLRDIHVAHSNFSGANEYIIDVFENMTNWIGAQYGCGAAETYVRVPVSLELK